MIEDDWYLKKELSDVCGSFKKIDGELTSKAKCTMKNIFIICLLTIISGSCQDRKPPIIPVSRIDSFKNSLVGKWGGLDESLPVWKITQDSIYYYDQNKSYPYTILENDLVVNMGKSKPKLKNISVKDDTLFFYSRVSVEKEIYELTKAFKFK